MAPFLHCSNFVSIRSLWSPTNTGRVSGSDKVLCSMAGWNRHIPTAPGIGIHHWAAQAWSFPVSQCTASRCKELVGIHIFPATYWIDIDNMSISFKLIQYSSRNLTQCCSQNFRAFGPVFAWLNFWSVQIRWRNWHWTYLGFRRSPLLRRSFTTFHKVSGCAFRLGTK